MKRKLSSKSDSKLKGDDLVGEKKSVVRKAKTAKSLKSSPKLHVKKKTVAKSRINGHQVLAGTTLFLLVLIGIVIWEDGAFRSKRGEAMSVLMEMMGESSSLNRAKLGSSLQTEYRSALRNSASYFRQFRSSGETQLHMLMLGLQQLNIAKKLAIQKGTDDVSLQKLQDKLNEWEGEARDHGLILEAEASSSLEGGER